MRDYLLFVLYAAGCVAVVIGLWMAWEPLGVIAAGAALVVGALRLGAAGGKA